jgi:hypothetical protein
MNWKGYERNSHCIIWDSIQAFACPTHATLVDAYNNGICQQRDSNVSRYLGIPHPPIAEGHNFRHLRNTICRRAVPSRTAPHHTVPTQHATMASHGTRSRGISRDLRVSASDATHPSPGSLLRYGSVNTPSSQQWRLYDWGFFKRNWNI